MEMRFEGRGSIGVQTCPLWKTNDEHGAMDGAGASSLLELRRRKRCTEYLICGRRKSWDER